MRSITKSKDPQVNWYNYSKDSEMPAGIARQMESIHQRGIVKRAALGMLAVGVAIFTRRTPEQRRAAELKQATQVAGHN